MGFDGNVIGMRHHPPPWSTSSSALHGRMPTGRSTSDMLQGVTFRRTCKPGTSECVDDGSSWSVAVMNTVLRSRSLLRNVASHHNRSSITTTRSIRRLERLGCLWPQNIDARGVEYGGALFNRTSDPGHIERAPEFAQPPGGRIVRTDIDGPVLRGTRGR